MFFLYICIVNSFVRKKILFTLLTYFTSDKIKMPKSITERRINSFITIENMNVEKLRAT